MIVVTTPTGQIGSKLVKGLVSAGEEVRVIVRDAATLEERLRGAVEVVQGSSDDVSVLLRAFDGAESLFLVVPPSFTTDDEVAYYMRFTRPVCEAISRKGVKRVIAVSGIGRDPNVKAGPVRASLLKDLEIEKTRIDFRALWCPGFMENMLRAIPALRYQGIFTGAVHADLKLPLVATKDIAAAGAKLLTDRAWTGQGGLAVLGPEDLSPNDQAAIIAEVLEKPIRYVEMTGAAHAAQLVQFGASEHFAQGLVAMTEAKNNGLDHMEPRTPENTTPTTFRQWCEEVLKPAHAKLS